MAAATAIPRRLAGLGVEIILNRGVTAIGSGQVETACTYTGQTATLDADAVVLVTAQRQNNTIWTDLKSREAEWTINGITSVNVIGDAEAPAPIAWATYAGHRFARELDDIRNSDAPSFLREIANLATI
ncbi:MAG: hypothetical protein AAFP68_12850 [Pseudomonadota bacterium]